MKIYSSFLAIVLIIGMVSCNKDISDSSYFQPTDHLISMLGSSMRLTLVVPGKGIYSLSADSTTLICEGENCMEFMVSESEMNEMAQNLSDTIIFHWEFMTAKFPYPENDCKFLVYSGENQASPTCDCMCTIGSSNHTATILRELAESFSGDARNALNELAKYLTNHT